MAHNTGDLSGKISLLQRELKHIGYHEKVDLDSIRAGDPAPLLAILGFTLQRFSKHVADLAARKGLRTRPFSRFAESVLRIAREAFQLRTVLTPSQFLSEASAPLLVFSPLYL
jgi:hypothetical protein